MSQKVRVRDGVEQRFTSRSAPKRLAWTTDANGYPVVYYRVNGERFRAPIHRLVGFAFVPGHFDGATINHINGIKTDNRPENLEWVTVARNSQHAWETGLVDVRGENHPNAKLSSGKVRIIRRLLSIGANSNELAVLCDVSHDCIAQIRDGKRWNDVG